MYKLLRMVKKACLSVHIAAKRLLIRSSLVTIPKHFAYFEKRAFLIIPLPITPISLQNTLKLI